MSLKLKLKIAIIVMVVNALACATTGDIPVVKQPEEAAKVLSESLISILKKITITEKVTVAIMPFGGPKGKPTTFGKKMADLIQAKLLGYQWILVERNRIDSIIKEKTLISAGVIEEKNFIEIGTIMGADYAITGTTYYGKKALVVAKIIDISTGTVVGMAQVYIDFRDYE